MTTDEAITRIVRIKEYLMQAAKGLPCISPDGFHAINMAISALEQNKWIPCSERLPEVCGLGVLLTIENKFQQRKAIQGFTGYMEGGKLEFHTNDKCTNLEVWRVIAWQPLPSVWKGENNG